MSIVLYCPPSSCTKQPPAYTGTSSLTRLYHAPPYRRRKRGDDHALVVWKQEKTAAAAARGRGTDGPAGRCLIAACPRIVALPARSVAPGPAGLPAPGSQGRRLGCGMFVSFLAILSIVGQRVPNSAARTKTLPSSGTEGLVRKQRAIRGRRWGRSVHLGPLPPRPRGRAGMFCLHPCAVGVSATSRCLRGGAARRTTSRRGGGGGGHGEESNKINSLVRWGSGCGSLEGTAEGRVGRAPHLSWLAPDIC